jgi:hypothetical protein
MIISLIVEVYTLASLVGSGLTYLYEGVIINEIHALFILVWTCAIAGTGWILLAVSLLGGHRAFTRRSWERYWGRVNLYDIQRFNVLTCFVLASVQTAYMAIYAYVYAKFPAANVAPDDPGGLRYRDALITTGLGIVIVATIQLGYAASAAVCDWIWRRGRYEDRFSAPKPFSVPRPPFFPGTK